MSHVYVTSHVTHMCVDVHAPVMTHQRLSHMCVTHPAHMCHTHVCSHMGVLTCVLHDSLMHLHEKPHMSCPHMNCPHMNCPHMSCPHMGCPHMGKLPEHTYVCSHMCVGRLGHFPPPNPRCQMAPQASKPFRVQNASSEAHTGWRRCRGCLKLHVSFRKRATIYRALLREMTCKDKAS